MTKLKKDIGKSGYQIYKGQDPETETESELDPNDKICPDLHQHTQYTVLVNEKTLEWLPVLFPVK
jgi:hypothetical protein